MMMLFTGNRKLQNVRGYVSMLVCVAIVLLLFLSSFYVASEFGHQCTGYDCQICENMHNCQEALNSIAAVALVFAFICCILSKSSGQILQFNLSVADKTPVGQKVRMDN